MAGTRRILVVEDEEDNRTFIAWSLRRAGYDVVGANGGADGIKKFEEEKPDMVILDILMPEVDGWQVLEKIRKVDHRTPIIMLTVRDSDKDKLSGFVMGADHYIGKPFAIEQLLRMVDEAFEEAGK